MSPTSLTVSACKATVVGSDMQGSAAVGWDWERTDSCSEPAAFTWAAVSWNVLFSTRGSGFWGRLERASALICCWLSLCCMTQLKGSSFNNCLALLSVGSLLMDMMRRLSKSLWSVMMVKAAEPMECLNLCTAYTTAHSSLSKSGMDNFNDRQGHKNVILTTWGPNCNHTLPPVGHCIPIIKLANLTQSQRQRQSIHIPEWYTIISVQWCVKNHYSIKVHYSQSATVITKNNIYVWCPLLLSALPFHDMFHIYGMIFVPHSWRSNGRFWAQKNIFC